MNTNWTDDDRQWFLQRLEAKARGSMVYGAAAADAVELALDELHSELSQRIFFGIRDEIGGQPAIINYLSRKIEGHLPVPIQDENLHIFTGKDSCGAAEEGT